MDRRNLLKGITAIGAGTLVGKASAGVSQEGLDPDRVYMLTVTHTPGEWYGPQPLMVDVPMKEGHPGIGVICIRGKDLQMFKDAAMEIERSPRAIHHWELVENSNFGMGNPVILLTLEYSHTTLSQLKERLIDLDDGGLKEEKRISI